MSLTNRSEFLQMLQRSFFVWLIASQPPINLSVLGVINSQMQQYTIKNDNTLMRIGMQTLSVQHIKFIVSYSYKKTQLDKRILFT